LAVQLSSAVPPPRLGAVATGTAEADAEGGAATTAGQRRSITDLEQLQPNAAVRWTCIVRDMPSWVGTTLDWKLSQQGDSVLVSFEHSGWRLGDPGRRGLAGRLAGTRAIVLVNGFTGRGRRG
jgi:hypothetical protein